jgi:hypothetical protein
VNKTPLLRQGVTQVSGRLPPEVVQRIVRLNFGRFRICYEKGLRANPHLVGRVVVKFHIDRSGAVASAKDAGSDIPDSAVTSCIVRGFDQLSSPQPEAGVVAVVYPILLSLEEAPTPLKRPPRSSGASGDAIGDAFGEGGLGVSR